MKCDVVSKRRKFWVGLNDAERRGTETSNHSTAVKQKMTVGEFLQLLKFRYQAMQIASCPESASSSNIVDFRRRQALSRTDSTEDNHNVLDVARSLPIKSSYA